MPQTFTNLVVQILTQNNVPVSDISVLHQSREEVAVSCQISWEFSHETHVNTTNGAGGKQEDHYGSQQEFDLKLAGLQQEAMHDGGSHSAFMSSAMQDKEGLFGSEAARNLGRIGAISVHQRCSACNGARSIMCEKCAGSGRRACGACGGPGKNHGHDRSCHHGKINCGWCHNGRKSCEPCDATGLSTKVAKVDLIALRGLEISADSSVLQQYLTDSLPLSQYLDMMQLVAQERVPDSNRILFTFKAEIVKIQLRVCGADYSMQLLVHSGRWLAMSAGKIFDRLLAPVLAQMRGLVSEGEKAPAKALDQFKHCMGTPVLQPLLSGIKHEKRSDAQLIAHLKTKCNAFISDDCAQAFASMFNRLLDFLTPTFVKKEYERPLVWAFAFVLFWSTLLAEHGFSWFGDAWLARGLTALLMSLLFSAVLFAIFGAVAENRSKRRCQSIQSALPAPLRRAHDISALQGRASKRFVKLWLGGTVLGLGCALFDVTLATCALELAVNGLEAGFMLLSALLF